MSYKISVSDRLYALSWPKFSSLLPCSCEPQVKQGIQIQLKILVNFVSQAKFGLRYFVKSDGKFDVW